MCVEVVTLKIELQSGQQSSVGDTPAFDQASEKAPACRCVPCTPLETCAVCCCSVSEPARFSRFRCALSILLRSEAGLSTWRQMHLFDS
eukprot:6209382-Pleurochrysis_carterae.AAC.2